MRAHLHRIIFSFWRAFPSLIHPFISSLPVMAPGFQLGIDPPLLSISLPLYSHHSFPQTFCALFYLLEQEEWGCPWMSSLQALYSFGEFPSALLDFTFWSLAKEMSLIMKLEECPHTLKSQMISAMTAPVSLAYTPVVPSPCFSKSEILFRTTSLMCPSLHLLYDCHLLNICSFSYCSSTVCGLSSIVSNNIKS